MRRVTFSRSLADYLARLTGTTVARCQIHVGRRLRPDEKSPSGVYALVSRRGTILRVSVIHGFAQELADWSSRHLHLCTLTLLAGTD